MTDKTRHKNLIGLVLLVVGIGLGFVLYSILIPKILVILGLEILLFELVKSYLFKKSSLETLGHFILVFSLLNFLRHSLFFTIIFRIGELFEATPDFVFFLTREIIWLALSLWILSIGIKLAKKKKKIGFNRYIKSPEFQKLSYGILLLLVLEIPVFDVHGGFVGGMHGHGFWEIGTHIH